MEKKLYIPKVNILAESDILTLYLEQILEEKE